MSRLIKLINFEGCIGLQDEDKCRISLKPLAVEIISFRAQNHLLEFTTYKLNFSLMCGISNCIPASQCNEISALRHAMCSFVKSSTLQSAW